MAAQTAGRGDYPVWGTNRDTAGCGAGGGDVVREEGSMSKRRNGTNRAGAAIGVNIYTGKLAPRKKKNLTAATVQVQVNK